MRLPCALACVAAATWLGAGADSSTSGSPPVHSDGQEEALSELLNCKVTASREGKPTDIVCGEHEFSESEQLEIPGTATWWRNLILAAACVCVAAFAAGMTLGMMALDSFQLRVLCNRSVNDVEPTSPETRKEEQDHLVREQAYAKRILPMISGHFLGEGCHCPHRLNPSNAHYLLVTLLLTNAAANEALPIFLDGLVPSWLAVLLSVTVVLLFGEIVPSAVFRGRFQLKLAALLVPVIRLLRLLYLPVVFPISLLLDTFLGHEEDEPDRGEVKALARTLGELHKPEVRMIHGVLEMHAKAPSEISRPIASARMLPSDAVIDEATINKLVEWGHSRIFLYRRDPEDPLRTDDIVGVLLVKKLLGCKLNEGTRVDTCTQALKEPIVLGPEDNLLWALNKFQEGMCHLAVVSDSPGVLIEALQQGKSAPVSARAKMFCSLEDVIEAMMNEKIFDEADVEMGRARVNSHSRDFFGSFGGSFGGSRGLHSGPPGLHSGPPQPPAAPPQPPAPPAPVLALSPVAFEKDLAPQQVERDVV